MFTELVAYFAQIVISTQLGALSTKNRLIHGKILFLLVVAAFYYTAPICVDCQEDLISTQPPPTTPTTSAPSHRHRRTWRIMRLQRCTLGRFTYAKQASPDGKLGHSLGCATAVPAPK